MVHWFFRQYKKPLISFGVLLVALGALISFHFYRYLHSPVLTQQEEVVVWIQPGTPVRHIVKLLSQKGVLKHPNQFLLALYALGASNKLQAGEYQIKMGTTPLEIINQLSTGKVVQHAFTIVPGWSFYRLLTELHHSPIIVHTLEDISADEMMAKLGKPGVFPEGQFFPETYHFTRGTTDQEILERAHSLLNKKLNDLWERYQAITPLNDRYEALILASIIEKESSVSDEFGEIAGVYTRRLQKRMPLQADPTVIYGLGPEFSGLLSKKLLKEKTPYNTYQRLGLPPTPIALPSEMAIEAALNPLEGDSLYFVAKPGGGGHVFSKTLKEHLRAVQQYRQFLSGKRKDVY